MRLRQILLALPLMWVASATAALADSGQDKTVAAPSAGVYEGLPFPMRPVETPVIPDREYDFSRSGLQGDGKTLVTEALQTAIDRLSGQGGGRLTLPAGVWLTGPLTLKSHIELHLQSGAILLFSPDTLLYPMRETIFEGRPALRRQSPISAYEATDIAITGQGVINGSGHYWRPLKKAKTNEAQWNAITALPGKLESERLFVPEGSRSTTRPVMLQLGSCRRVALEGVTFMNSPAWCLHLLMCRDVTLNGLRVQNPEFAQNGDGLDLESCRRAVIRDCVFDVGDDAICMKSGKDEAGRRRGIPTEEVIIRDCTVFSGHGGFVIGSEMSGGVRNVSVARCQFIGTDTGLRFKSTRGRGGIVEDIFIRDIAMTDIKGDAINFNLYYFSGKEGRDDKLPVDETTPQFRRITMENISCGSCTRACSIVGLPEMPVRDVTMRNIHIQAKEENVFRYCENVEIN